MKITGFSLSYMLKNKYLGYIAFISVIYFVLLYVLCEYLIYYIIIFTCSWPKLNPGRADSSIEDNGEEPVRAMFLTDLHLVKTKPEDNTWFNKDRHIWAQQHMRRSFRAAVNIHQPEVIFVLGDLTEHGLSSNDEQFNNLISLFKDYFSVTGRKMYIVPGNHDVGFHRQISYERQLRFLQTFNSTSVELVTIRNNHFILLNSAALENDGCPICKPAEIAIKNIHLKLDCINNRSDCKNVERVKKYSRPILIQHIPLYRYSDRWCKGIDVAPAPLKEEPFRPTIDCLSEFVSDRLLDTFNPRLAFAGHIHHGCVMKLKNYGVEFTLPSFNILLKENPNFALALFTPNNYALKKCQLPKEWVFTALYIVGILFYLFLIYRYTKRHLNSNYYVLLNNKNTY